MQAPVGTEMKKVIPSPIKKQAIETITEQIVTERKLLHTRIEVSDGKIIRLDISSAPISLIPITMITAVSRAISIL